jgi:hypothetical protein
MTSSSILCPISLSRKSISVESAKMNDAIAPIRGPAVGTLDRILAIVDFIISTTKFFYYYVGL